MNWLSKMMAQKGLTSSQLSRTLEEKYGLDVSRQVIDNWLKMESERIPVQIGNYKLVCALAKIFGYYDVELFMKELGFQILPDRDVPDGMQNLISRLSTYEGEQAEAISILLGQILDRWGDVEDRMKARSG